MTRKITSNIVRSLPEDMLADILKHAASNSVIDFVNIGLSCKAFHGASNYDDIFKNVSMKKYSLIPWRKSESFSEKCEVAKNVEAFYKKGMIDCFRRRKTESGLYCLRKASENGHVDAIYVCGIILICFGGELREQGLQLLSHFRLEKYGKRSSRIIVGCRLKTKKFLSSMWVHVTLPRPKPIDCNCNKDTRERSNCLSAWEGQTWEASNNVGHGCSSCFGTVKQFCFVVFLGKI